RDQVGGGHRRRGVAGPGGGAGADGVDAQLLAQLTQELEVFLGQGFRYCHVTLHLTAFAREAAGARAPTRPPAGPPPGPGTAALARRLPPGTRGAPPG